MADNLTVKGGPSTPTAEPKAEGKSREDTELDRLRGIAKKHHGKELNDKTLKAIVARRKAKITKAQKLDETKREFQTDQGKEKVAAKATDRQAQSQKAMGTREARGPSRELPAKEGKQVRSNPESGPKLPPTLDKATSPEQAARLLDKMFSFITVDGEAFDQKAYAETIKEKPPTQPKEQGKQGKQGQPGKQTAPGQQATRQAGTQPQTQTQQPSLAQQPPKADGKPGQKSTGKTAAGKTAEGKAQPGKAQPGKTVPGKLGQSSAALRSGSGQTSQPQTTAPTGRGPGQMPSAPGAPGPAAMPAQGTGPALAMSTRSAGASLQASSVANPSSLLGSTGVSSEGLINSGGGLITNSKFDGMSFNWDAFNWFFTMVVMKDLHKYRKEMKELRRQEGKAAIAGMRLKHAIKQMRQIFDRNKAVADFFEEVKNAVGKIKGEVMKAKANEALGDVEKQAVANDRERAKLEEQRDGLKGAIDQLKANMATMEAEGKTGTPEYKEAQAQVADKEKKLEGVEGKITENLERAEELKQLRADLKREQSDSGGQIGDLARAYAKRHRGEITNEKFQEHLAKYRDTIASLQGHHEVVPYMEQRGAELTESWRNALRERPQLIERKERAETQLKDLKDSLGTPARATTSEEQTQIRELDEEILAAQTELQNIRHIGIKAMLHDAVMMSLTTPSDRQQALGQATDRIELAKSRITALTKSPPDAAQPLKNFELSNDPQEIESVGFWENQLEDMQDAEGLLKWGAEREEIGVDDIMGRDGNPGLLQRLHHRSPERRHADRQGSDGRRQRGRQRNGMRVAGDLLRTARQDRGTWGKIGSLVQGAGTILDQVEAGTASAMQAAEGAVDRTIDTSINIDMQARHEANAMLRRHSSRAQGMVNQLMQVLRMQRSG